MPGIWLVQGHTSCSGLTGQVTAVKLADILRPGEDRRRIPGLSWSDFRGSCVMVLQSPAEEPARAIVTLSPTTNVIAAQNEATTTTTTTAVESVTTTPALPEALAGERRERRIAGGGILRLVPAARFFLPINLAAFTILSAGSSSRYQRDSSTSVSVFSGLNSVV